ncbi:MAG: TraB/GumN family protein [Niabella sp.]|nr:TraB/GumN family protein [Niabella sp.]
MKKISIFILVALLSTPIFSQNKPKTILWEIKGNGLTHKSYLFGTNHSFNGTWIDSFTVVKQKLLEAKTIAVEVKGATADKVNTLSVDTTHISIKELFKDSTYALVNNYLKAKGLSSLDNAPENFYSVLGLYFATFGRLIQPNEKENTDAIDRYIEQLGKEKKGIIYLDSGIEKIKTDSIAALNEKNMANLIVWCIKNENNPDSIKLVVNASKPALDEFRNLSVEYNFNQNLPIVYGQLERELILKRNNYWVDKLPSILKTGNVFIAVGLQHLKYKEGLINQLRELGYTVSPVKIVRKYSR